MMNPGVGQRPSQHRKGEVAFRALVVLFVTAGFVYQVAIICEDYFGYPTTTLVSILTALPLTTAPAVAFSFWKYRHDVDRTMRSKELLVGEYFALVQNPVRFKRSRTRDAKGKGAGGRGAKVLNISKLYRDGYYYVYMR